MSIIKDISDSHKNLRRTERENRIDREKKTDKQKKSKSGKVSSNHEDEVQISSSGRSMMESVSRVPEYEDQMKKIENLDQEQLKKVHERVKENYYDDPEVINDIVDTLTSSIPESAVDNVETGSDHQDLQISSERLNEIKKNIEENKYDDDEVIDSIVDRMTNPRFL